MSGPLGGWSEAAGSGTARAAVVHEVRTPDDVRELWPLMSVLRPRLTGVDELASAWGTQVEDGYRLAYVRDRDGRPVGAVGFRVTQTLAWGRHVYIDDLVVAESSRRGGIGALLLAYVEREAEALGCSEIHLDTGYERHDAHRLYLRHGYEFSCHHASKPVRRLLAPTPQDGLDAARAALAPLIDELRAPLDHRLREGRPTAEEEVRFAGSVLPDHELDAWLTRTRARLSELAARGLLRPTTDLDRIAAALGAAVLGGRAAALRARSISAFDVVVEGAVVLLWAHP